MIYVRRKGIVKNATFETTIGLNEYKESMNEKIPWTMSTLNALLTGMLFFLLERDNSKGVIALGVIILVSVVAEIVITHKVNFAFQKLPSFPTMNTARAAWIVFSFSLAFLLSYLTLYFLTTSSFNLSSKYFGTDGSINIDFNQALRDFLFVYITPLVSGNIGAWLGLRLLTPHKSLRILFLGIFLSALLFPVGTCLFSLFLVAYQFEIRLTAYWALEISVLAISAQMLAMKRS